MPKLLRISISVLAPCLALVVGCVSRNVEPIPADEAAAMPPPAEPVSPADRAGSVVELQGVDGTIGLAAELGGSAPSGTLYVILRVSGREGGPPLAVKRLPAELPATFRITEADSMIPGTPLVGDLDVIARLDQDGDAFSRQTGDLEGRAGPVQVGGSVEITLRAPAAGEGS